MYVEGFASLPVELVAEQATSRNRHIAMDERTYSIFLCLQYSICLARASADTGRAGVTGATGKVGSRLANRLAQRGDHVRDPTRAASVRRFIFTSTGPVYGSNGGRLAREDDPCAPTAPYPMSKLAAERFLLALEGLDVRVLRLPPDPRGPRLHPRFPRLADAIAAGAAGPVRGRTAGRFTRSGRAPRRCRRDRRPGAGT